MRKHTPPQSQSSTDKGLLARGTAAYGSTERKQEGQGAKGRGQGSPMDALKGV